MTTATRGRPRSVAIDLAILDATATELIQRGFLGLTMEAVAARAGVAKTTLYRRWPNTTELALEAMNSFEEEVADPPDGSVREQLLWQLERMRRKWNNPRYSAIMRRVLADGTSEPALYLRSRDRLVGPHLARMNRTLERGIAEGVLRPDIDVGWARQLLTAPIMAAALTLKERVRREQIELTLDTVLRGLAP